MHFDQALEYLLSLGHETLAIKLGLSNTERLLKALSYPQTAYPSVQIAGTNGKGSVVTVLNSICGAAGIRTGLFTSPHLISITERIQIDGRHIPEADFAQLTTRVRQTAAQLIRKGELEALPTFFEQVTAIAMLAFGAAGVELAVLETGLGGRLDSTTAARAELVAITPIAMDHQEYLGHTLAQIAAEKAAIIRPGVTAIIAPQSREALEVLLRQCVMVSITPRFSERWEGGPSHTAGQATIVNTSDDGRCCVTFETQQDKYEEVWLGLRGRHQVTNASLAIGLAEALRERGFVIPREAIIHGVARAIHPGRLEWRAGQPPVLFDGAHNPAGARALYAYLEEFVKRPITMIFGAMRDKALDEMAAILFPAADKLILTGFDNPRAATAEMLLRLAPAGFDQSKIRQAASAGDALRIATELTPAGGLVCVTGSLYLIGAVQQIEPSSVQSPMSNV